MFYDCMASLTEAFENPITDKVQKTKTIDIPEPDKIGLFPGSYISGDNKNGYNIDSYLNQKKTDGIYTYVNPPISKQ
tara:strand:- start:35 stop:265 length:231 start_codon:yes stop_codon:yes gene_type:complete